MSHCARPAWLSRLVWGNCIGVGDKWHHKLDPTLNSLVYSSHSHLSWVGTVPFDLSTMSASVDNCRVCDCCALGLEVVSRIVPMFAWFHTFVSKFEYFLCIIFMYLEKSIFVFVSCLVPIEALLSLALDDVVCQMLPKHYLFKFL